MDKLIDALRWIHGDLMTIGAILLFFVLFKDCHGYSNSGIVDELRNIKSVIQHKIK